MLFGAELWEWVNQTTSRAPVITNPVPAVRRWRRFCEGWSRYDRWHDHAGRYAGCYASG